MSAIEVTLPTAAPALILQAVRGIVATYPGQDVLTLNVGPRRLSVHGVRDCRELQLALMACLDG